MNKFKYAILCEQAIINRETGQISIINIVNGIGVPSLPVTVNTLFLVLSWQRDMAADQPDESFDVRILVSSNAKNPKTKPSTSKSFKVKFTNGNFVANAISRLNVQFHEAGENQIIIERKSGDEWKVEGAVPFKIITEKAVIESEL